ncbi:MAG: 1,4-dihydroxy-2-naphthoate octaprenyltransferase [Marinilabiliaceae bacterium]|nr:1,4-dihydroxy-2-naphthoate octaprenyltransferase [Marinilabiliaceae bacterium]
MNIKQWVVELRLRTLPLSFALIIMGSALAWQNDVFSPSIFVLALTTTLFLQISSNLANDYGDAVSGVDFAGRVGPARGVQNGSISMKSLKKAIVLCALLAFFSGVALLCVAYPRLNLTGFIFMLVVGLLAIAAAITYTVGRYPYGYHGLGDLGVFVFFGIVGVAGSYTLYAGMPSWASLLPASAIGFLSIGVLNMNNIRDINADEAAGKRTLVVRMGMHRAKIYHAVVMILAVVCLFTYVFLFGKPHQGFFAVSIPFIINNINTVMKAKEPSQIDGQLKRVSMLTLLIVVVFTFGTIV